MKFKLLVLMQQKIQYMTTLPLPKMLPTQPIVRGSAGKLEFSYIRRQPDNMTEGARIQFYVDGKEIYQGYVFTIKQSRDGEISVTAYDQSRYLKSNASYSFVGKKLGEIIQQIAADMRLSVGTLEDTGYVIPTLTKEDTECFDIIDYGLVLTQNNTGKTFVFYDDFGKLSLRKLKI